MIWNGKLKIRYIGRVDGQERRNRTPLCGIIESVERRRTVYEINREMPDKLTFKRSFK